MTAFPECPLCHAIGANKDNGFASCDNMDCPIVLFDTDPDNEAGKPRYFEGVGGND